jgi:hypothetical protein
VLIGKAYLMLRRSLLPPLSGFKISESLNVQYEVLLFK